MTTRRSKTADETLQSAPAVPGPLPRTTDPPMSDAAYQAELTRLDAERAALRNDYVTSQTYPRVAYHATEPPQTVSSDEEALALGEGWSATPVAAPVEAEIPVVTALEPDTVVLGSPSFTVHVIGTGFVAESVIVWNGSDEATVPINATELTTDVNMATATVAVSVPVAVRNGDVVSNALSFTFTEATS